MIREICRCPYCGGGAVALDDETLEMLFEPDRVGSGPCEHCAFVSVGLHTERHGRVDPERSCAWFWGVGEGQRRVPVGVPAGPLVEFVDMLACELLPAEWVPKGVVFQVTGGTAHEREGVRPGSGTFTVTGDDGPAVEAILDGWGIYSPEPAALADLVRRPAAS